MAIDLDETKIARNEPVLWLGWTLATAAGMLLGLVPIALLIDLLDLWLVRLLVPVWAGFMVGILQWLVLRSYMTHCADWILNGGAGWALGYALGLFVIHSLSQNVIGALLGYILFGLIIALVQWPVLRREIPDVIPWVLASIFGWGLGAVAGQAIMNAVAAGEPVSQVLNTAVISGVTGLVAGAVTGLALVFIVRHPEVEVVRSSPKTGE
jgi:hypothetical protein